MDRGKSAGYSRFFPLICPSPPEFSRKFRCFCRLRRPISGQTLPRGDPNGPKTSRPAHLRGPPPGPGIAPVPSLQQRQHQKIPSAQRRNGCPRDRQLRRGEYAVSAISRRSVYIAGRTAAAFGGAPHQSSLGSEEPRDDSFSPWGEALSRIHPFPSYTTMCEFAPKASPLRVVLRAANP